MSFDKDQPTERNHRHHTAHTIVALPRPHDRVAPTACLPREHGVPTVVRVSVACRTPHRPNPIGLSLARLLSVDMKTRTVELAGTDLVDGTPILDIKPYLSSYDAPMPGQECFAPAWSLDPGGERPVEFLPAAEADWAACSGALKIYKGDATLARSALEQILASVRPPP